MMIKQWELKMLAIVDFRMYLFAKIEIIVQFAKEELVTARGSKIVSLNSLTKKT